MVVGFSVEVGASHGQWGDTPHAQHADCGGLGVDYTFIQHVQMLSGSLSAAGQDAPVLKVVGYCLGLGTVYVLWTGQEDGNLGAVGVCSGGNVEA